eukprot:138308_1
MNHHTKYIMTQAGSDYPIDRIQSTTSTPSRPSAKRTPSTYTNGAYKPYQPCSGNVIYKSSSKPNITPHNTAMGKAQTDNNKYKRGIVIVTPQNDTTPGWIYCKANNAMYQLPFDLTTHYIVNQIVLFNATSQLRGLNLTEARSLMQQGKLNIKHYNNYFVAQQISKNIHHTQLIALDEINTKYLTEHSESMSNKPRFVLNTTINVRENNEIEFKLFDGSKRATFPMDKVVHIMERYLNGFVNMNGGAIYIGIDDDGRVIGQDLYHCHARKILDEIQLRICQKLREWTPKQYTQRLMRLIKIDMIDVIRIDDAQQVGFVVPNKKVIKASIATVQDSKGNNVIFGSSQVNHGCVYVRHLSSLCAYRDDTMQQQIGKRQICKLNMNNESECESDIDFDDDDEKDWIDVDELRNDIEYNAKRNSYFDPSLYAKRITNMFQNIHNTLTK